jgi:flavin-dependent dehydrogenase
MAYGYALPRSRLDALLVEAAVRAGAQIEEGSAVEELLYDQGAVGGVVARAHGADRRVCRARVVVGADGLRSVVARRLGLRRSSFPARLAFTAHYTAVAGMGDVGEMHIGRSGYVGMGPIGGGVTTVALVLPVSAARPRAAALRRDEGLRQALEGFPRLRGRFAGAVLAREVLVTGPFAQWSRHAVAPGGGALLVGDAADFFDPFTGQGLYSALRGAELAAAALADALATGGRGPLPAAALDPYRAARRRAFSGKWLLERLIGVGVGWELLARRVVGRLARRPGLADLVVGATGNFVPARAVLAPSFLLQLLW